jgi:polyisoprenoid-binding protein YceI
MTTPSSVASAVTYTIDPAHTLVELSAKHMMFTTVKGRFSGISGTIVHDGPDGASVDAQIDAASLTTGDVQRDQHLRSADFLDVENYPKITFTSTRVDGSGSAEHFKLIGDLTIHGITREVILDTEFNGSGTNPYGQQLAGFSAQTEINRKDFGLNWNVALETGGVLVSDKIKVRLEVQGVRA